MKTETFVLNDAVTNEPDAETKKKLSATVVELMHHSLRIIRSRTRIKFNDGIIDKISFRDVVGKKATNWDPTACDDVIRQVLAHIQDYPHCTLEFVQGKLIALKIDRARRTMPHVVAVGGAARPTFDPERYFQDCDESVLDELVSLNKRDGCVTNSVALSKVIENGGRNDFAAELKRCAHVSKGANGALTRALQKKGRFVRGPFSISLLRIKNKYGNWSHGVLVTKTTCDPLVER